MKVVAHSYALLIKYHVIKNLNNITFDAMKKVKV